MNTVISEGTVKTVEAEKEIFNCVFHGNNDPVFKEITLFIEKLERFDGPELYEERTNFKYSTCMKYLTNASVISCTMQPLATNSSLL